MTPKSRRKPSAGFGAGASASDLDDLRHRQVVEHAEHADHHPCEEQTR